MSDRILCVDDEPNILHAFRRQLRANFELEVATNPTEALALLEGKNNFKVIVSDMRMPGLDGVQFLQEVEKRSPDSVRIMLTGNADKLTPIQAINLGHVFRYLTKPCSVDALEVALREAVQHYHVQQAERELLQKTVGGTVRLLTEILAAVDPTQFKLTRKRIELGHSLMQPCGIRNSWELDLALMLSEIGRATLPPEVQLKQRQGSELSETERGILDRVPEISSTLLRNIPRLEQIAEAILYKNRRFDSPPTSIAEKHAGQIPLLARFIKIICDLEELESAGKKRSDALAEMVKRGGCYDTTLLRALITGRNPETELSPTPGEYAIGIRELCVGQTLLADVQDSAGRLLLAKGSLLSEVVISRLKHYAELVGVKEPLLVDSRIPVTGM
jgi:response regulator RpfG family c-di-GMP phosphodiesterase